LSEVDVGSYGSSDIHRQHSLGERITLGAAVLDDLFG